MKCFCILISFLFYACSPTKVQTKLSNSDKDNNQVVVDSKNTIHNSTGESELIFEGNNNLIEVSYDSSVYEGKNNRNVTIVKGNQNNIQITQHKVYDHSENANDTTYIVGNKQKFNLSGKQIVNERVSNREKSVIAKQSSSNGLESITVAQTTSTDLTFVGIETKSLTEDSLKYFNDTTLIEIAEFPQPVKIKEALNFYFDEIRGGSFKAYYKVGLFFQLGVGTKVNSLKAEEYFEIAARNGVSEAQMNLGYFYEFGFWEVKIDRQKAIFYYRMAAAQGNQDAQERLIELGE